MPTSVPLHAGSAVNPATTVHASDDHAREPMGDELVETADDDDKDANWRTADEIRHANYMALRKHFRENVEDGNLPDRGALQRFSDYVGIASRYVGHIERKKKKIGRKIARKFEEAFGLEQGWLDVDRRNGTLAFDPDAREFASLAMRLYLRDRDGVKAALMRYMESQIDR